MGISFASIFFWPRGKWYQVPNVWGEKCVLSSLSNTIDSCSLPLFSILTSTPECALQVMVLSPISELEQVSSRRALENEAAHLLSGVVRIHFWRCMWEWLPAPTLEDRRKSGNIMNGGHQVGENMWPSWPIFSFATFGGHTGRKNCKKNLSFSKKKIIQAWLMIYIHESVGNKLNFASVSGY